MAGEALIAVLVCMLLMNTYEYSQMNKSINKVLAHL